MFLPSLLFVVAIAILAVIAALKFSAIGLAIVTLVSIIIAYLNKALWGHALMVIVITWCLFYNKMHPGWLESLVGTYILQ